MNPKKHLYPEEAKWMGASMKLGSPFLGMEKLHG